MTNNDIFDMQQAKNYLHAYWRNVLLHLLGWPEAEVAAWIAAADKTWDFADSESLLYHKPAMYWLMATIVHHFDAMITEAQFNSVSPMIQRALNVTTTDYANPNINWDYYKEALRNAIQTHLLGRNKIIYKRKSENRNIVVPEQATMHILTRQGAKNSTVQKKYSTAFA